MKDNAKWESILKEVDVNGDGVISFDEFTCALESFIDQIYNPK